MPYTPPPASAFENISVYRLSPVVAAAWDALAYQNLAHGAAVRRDYEAAVTLYEKALELAPAGLRRGFLYSDLALSRLRTGDLEGAVDAYGWAAALEPTNHEVRYGAGLAFLKAGDFEAGWVLATSRHAIPRAAATLRFDAPPMTALPRAGERVVVWTEQGMGDRILAASLLPDLVATGAVITLVVMSRLVALFQRSFPTVEVVAEEGRAEILGRSWAAQAALIDVARWLRPNFAAFPGSPYLRADAPLAACLRRRYRESFGGRPLIGLSWTTLTPKFPDEKTIPLDRFRWLADRRAALVNLQYGEVSAEIGAALERGLMILSDDRIDAGGDLDLFAAQVAAMDLVITTSNATAHLAGALGVPCVVLTARGMGDMWHWFDGREDSPFYGSVRVVRQALRGVWLGAMARAAELVDHFLTTGAFDAPETTAMRDAG